MTRQHTSLGTVDRNCKREDDADKAEKTNPPVALRRRPRREHAQRKLPHPQRHHEERQLGRNHDCGKTRTQAEQRKDRDPAPIQPQQERKEQIELALDSERPQVEQRPELTRFEI
jgi:hypothetical protein